MGVVYIYWIVCNIDDNCEGSVVLDRSDCCNGRKFVIAAYGYQTRVYFPGGGAGFRTRTHNSGLIRFVLESSQHRRKARAQVF